MSTEAAWRVGRFESCWAHQRKAAVSSLLSNISTLALGPYPYRCPVYILSVVSREGEGEPISAPREAALRHQSPLFAYTIIWWSCAAKTPFKERISDMSGRNGYLTLGAYEMLKRKKGSP